ncbi:hypothetical protein [Candidatus Palauibacter sp.]|uniref:hypothetical protein n=1 Tax=Candidatus Palauibacter sp. TaxID=3101350 RepID=UPI003B597D59
MKIPGEIDVPQHLVVAVCKRWRIAELALFGSVVREDFGLRGIEKSRNYLRRKAILRSARTIYAG